MKQILLLIMITLSAVCVKAQKESDYSNWLFMQSDKSLQYRMAEVKKEGNIAFLQLQFRVKSDDEVHCNTAQCEGLLLYLYHSNVAQTEKVEYHFLFDKSFEGDGKVYTMQQLVPVEFKTWPDGSKRYLNKERGIVYTKADTGTEEFNAYVINVCVGNRIVNQPKNHRCKWEFKPELAVVVK